jgi:hypothetical protein
MRCHSWLSRGGVVEVVCFAMLWAVFRSDEAGDEIAKVACLDDFKELELGIALAREEYRIHCIQG